MSKSSMKILARFGLFLTLMVQAQEIPINEPHLIPFPGIRMGLSFYNLVPTQNIQLGSVAGGWTASDILSGVAGTLELELLRYRWGAHFLNNPRMDAYSSLNFSLFSQLGAVDLPTAYPSRFLLNNSAVEGFSLNAQVTELSLRHSFSYQYSRRGRALAHLGTGFAHLELLQGDSNVRVLGSNGLGLHFGAGWRYRLLGRPGKRIFIGFDLGYSLRIFDLTGEQPGLALSNGATTGLSPIEGISLNTPDVSLNIEMGEFLFGAHTPYRDPYRLGLVTLGIGYGLNTYTDGVSIQYDSTDTHISIPYAGKLNRNLDLTLIKYNWPFHFLRQSNIDLLSGLGVRFWKNSKGTTLPDGWATTLTDGTTEFEGLKFSPRVWDIYLNHELLYPLGEHLHVKVNGGTGFASMTLYENELLDRLIDANTLTWQLGAGAGYTLRGDGSSKVAIGAGIRYDHQAFDIDMGSSNLSAANPGEIIPITHIDLSSLAFSLEIGLIFGGSSNSAQKAFESFKAKKFRRALELQDELLELVPNHHNRAALTIQRQMIEDSLITYYYRDVRTIVDKGRIETALSLITRGKQPPSEAMDQAVKSMTIEIAEEALIRAKQALQSLDHEAAEKNILLALKSDPTVLPVAKVLLSRSYIIRATILYQSGVYNRSLYWLRQADGMSDRYKIVTENLRTKIGDGRLDDANEGILREDRQMVLESMQDAKTLNPNLGILVDQHLLDLQTAISHIEDQTIGPMKRMALDNLLDDIDGLSPENFVPKIGMKGSLIARYVGNPERQFFEENYELWVYPMSEIQELWLYLQDGIIEKIEYKDLD